MNTLSRLTHNHGSTVFDAGFPSSTAYLSALVFLALYVFRSVEASRARIVVAAHFDRHKAAHGLLKELFGLIAVAAP